MTTTFSNKNFSAFGLDIDLGFLVLHHEYDDKEEEDNDKENKDSNTTTTTTYSNSSFSVYGLDRDLGFLRGPEANSPPS